MQLKKYKILYLNFLTLIFSSISCINMSLSFSKIDERFISEEELLQIKEEIQKEQYEIEENDPIDTRSIVAKKPWTLMIYMAADNDLSYFAWKNLKQMELIGSNHNINIIVQLNIPGNNTTKRYLIEKGKKRALNTFLSNVKEKLNSGSYQTLIDFFEWGVKNFPADNYGLFAWNHGTGDIEPRFGRAINPADLFYLNPTDNKFEIDRGISYVTLIYSEAYRHFKNDGKRGICFDDSFKSYISNYDLKIALSEIHNRILQGKKIGIIGFDACLMAMIGVSSVCKDYAEYFVGSQELEYGAGWKYDEVLEPFNHQALTPKDFAQHIVASYEKAYQKYINDYTLSAMDLRFHNQLEENINNLANTLIQALSNQQGRKVSDTLRKCKSTQYCTCFDEPSYIDLGDFYINLSQHVNHIILQNKDLEKTIQIKLSQLLTEGLLILKKLIIENKVGPKLKRAQGISIYFPEHTIISSYAKSPFALNNQWIKLLNKYIHG